MTIALVADLHFGTVPEAVALALADDVNAQAPDVVAVAGDLTMKARAHEFDAAARWMMSLAPPVIVIPGNHDLSEVNLVERFVRPFKRFRKATHAWPVPNFELGDAILVGLNTVASWQPHLKWQEGHVRATDLRAAETILKTQKRTAFKAIVAHHPFLPIAEIPRARPVRQARRALRMFAEQGVELLMSGHLHLSFAREYRYAGGTILTVGAPTALSTRMRGEQNGYWLIEVTAAELILRKRLRLDKSFVENECLTFPRAVRSLLPRAAAASTII